MDDNGCVRMSELLEIKNLTVGIAADYGKIEAVRDVSLSLREGETLAIVGESGCGKSMLCRSVMKLLPQSARIESGSILAEGCDITGYSERDMQKLRGSLFSMIFQDPMASLDLTMPVGAQISEAVLAHNRNMKKEAVYSRVIELMEMAGIERPCERYQHYPYHFSGGMRQRCILAMALAGNPKILLADEPTTALDVTIQAQILDLLRDIQRKLHTAVIFVSHDLGAVARIADRVAIMYAGKIVEIGTAEEIYHDPRHPYTWGLLRSLPALAREGESLYTIPGMPPTLVHPPKGDAFACRNAYALAIDYEKQPPMFRVSDTHSAASWLLDERVPELLRGGSAQDVESKADILQTQGSGSKADILQTQGMESGADAAQAYGMESRADVTQTQGMESKPHILQGSSRLAAQEPAEDLIRVQHLTHQFTPSKKTVIRAVDDVSFQMKKGEIFGLVGESGSGKSTLARCIMNIYSPAAGQIIYDGVDICSKAEYRRNKKRLEAERQIIFQDSASCLNPRMKVADIIAEPMKIHHRKPPRGSLRAEAAFQLYYVGMDESYLDKYPSQLSGGQRQRVAIARALSMEPKLLVADEPVASLDVSIQAQIINLFSHLRKEHGFSILFIAHDLAVVRYLCDRVGVMYHGTIVELAPVRELFEHPQHPYTRALLSAIPVPDPLLERKRRRLEFDGTKPEHPGELQEIAPGHLVRRSEMPLGEGGERCLVRGRNP